MTGVFDPDWVDPRPAPMPAQRPATFGEVWSANRVLARGDRMDAEAERLRREYEPLLSAVNADRAKRGLKPMVNPGLWTGPMDRRASADAGPFDFASMLDKRVTRDEQQSAIFGEIAAIRTRDPKFLSGVAGDLSTFRKGIIDREKAARAGARDVVARSSGFAQAATGFAAGVFETMHDPVNIASLPLGGGGGSLAWQAGRSVLVNGALELAQQPFVAQNREQLGEELTWDEGLLNVGMAAVGGVVGDVVLPQLAKAVAGAAGKAIKGAVPVDRQIAKALSRADLDEVADSDLANAWRGVPRDMMTPDERAAIHVIERDAEIRATSPFEPTPEGMDAHAARMQASMEAIVRANTADAPVSAPPVLSGGMATTPRPRLRTSGGRLANDVVSFFREKGYSEAQARGIAAGVAAESASNHMARNPTSGALGLGQWLGHRQKKLIERFGPNPTRRQQLEFLHQELQGGDHGGRKVLAQADEAAVLRSYVEDFMRPAKGAETSGDLSRGMAALGREGEDVARAIDVDLEGDAPIVRDPAMDAERVAIEAPEAGAVEIDYADLPQVRRDLFDGEESFDVAQDALTFAAIGRDTQGIEVASAVMPPVAENMVRLYRAQGDLSASRQGIDTTADALWFTSDPEIAAGYASKRNGEVYYLDVPAERARELIGEEAGSANVPLGEAAPMRQFTDLTSMRRAAMADGYVPTPPEVAEHVMARVGRPAEASAARAIETPTPAARDAIAAERLDGPAPIAAEARQLELFEQPHGDGARLQVDSLDHDIRLLADAADAGGTFRLEDGSEASIADILADIDEDAAMIETIRSCL